MANNVRIRASVQDQASGPVDKIRDKIEKLRSQGGKGFAIGAGAAITAKGLSLLDTAVSGVTQKIGESIEAASNLQQSAGAVESVFGTAADKVKAFGDMAAESFGLSKRAVQELGAQLGAQLQGMGFGMDEAADKTITLEKRAADLAATFGGSVTDAVTAISALMRGERDPIEKYGVSLKQTDIDARVAAEGLDTSTASAKKHSQAIAALDILMEQTSKTSGQFAREADTLAGAQARAAAKSENAAAKFGQVLLPVMTALTNAYSAGIDFAVAFGEKTAGVIDFLKPGLIGLAVVITATMIPAFVAWAASAAAAAAATIAAFAPVLIPLAAVAAAVVGISAAINTFAIDFGDMGAKIHSIADATGKSYDDVKDAIKRDMEETGASFEDAAKTVEYNMRRMTDAAFSESERQKEIFNHAASERADALAVETAAAAALPAALKDAADKAGAIVSGGPGHWAAKLEDGTTIYASSAAKLAAALPAALERAKNKGVEIVRKTPAELAAALEQGQTDWQTAWDNYGKVMEDDLTKGAEIAKLKGILTGKELAAGLASTDVEQRAAAEALKAEIEDRLFALRNDVPGIAHKAGVSYAVALEATKAAAGGAAGTITKAVRDRLIINLYKGGENVGLTWAYGIGSQRVIGEARRQAAKVANTVGGYLKGASPPKEGPLKDIDVGAYNIGKAFASNLGRAADKAREAARSVASAARDGLGVPLMTPALATAGAGGGLPVPAVSASGSTAGARELHIHLTVMGDLRAENKAEVVDALQREARFLDGMVGGEF